MSEFKITEVDEALAENIRKQFGQEAFDHLHLEGGKSFAAKDDDKIIGFISVSCKKMPYPFKKDIKEAYIDIIEVDQNYRRQGIAKKLIEKVTKQTQACGCYQLRAWSSEDKTEAIQMWKSLGFGLHPQEIISEKTGEKVKGYFVTKTS